MEPSTATLAVPGSDPNSINLKSKGVVPVAMLTTNRTEWHGADRALGIGGGDAYRSFHCRL